MRLSLVPRLFESARPPDIVLVHTSAVHDGKVSLGTEVNILPAAIEQARARGGLVVAQINPSMPYTYGDAEIDVEAIDMAIDVDEELRSLDHRAPNDNSAAIGAGVASLVEDGATIQVGIGDIPNAVLAALSGRHGLAVWSETISDGVLELERAGALDPGRPIVTTFLFGTAELYSWVDRNPSVRLLRTETVNNPATIATHPMVCSINTALQVDLHAQANASFVRGRIHSGFGGQPDFVVGALHSDGGHAVIALPSWHAKSGSSTIVSRLVEPVTSFQHSAVVTEQGQALLFGRSQKAQARQLIEEAAHPDAREALWESLGPTTSRD
jgi:acyl-CoA hydrolase